jgi:hypothetical protein
MAEASVTNDVKDTVKESASETSKGRGNVTTTVTEATIVTGTVMRLLLKRPSHLESALEYGRIAPEPSKSKLSSWVSADLTTRKSACTRPTV